MCVCACVRACVRACVCVFNSAQAKITSRRDWSGRPRLASQHAQTGHSTPLFRQPVLSDIQYHFLSVNSPSPNAHEADRSLHELDRRERERERDRDRDRDRDRETDRQTDRQTETQSERQRERQRERQTDRRRKTTTIR